MRSSRRIGSALAAAALAACGGAGGHGAPAGPPDPLQSLTFKEVTGTVTSADPKTQKCPVTPHFAAVVTVSHMQGTLRYRWVRAGGDSSILETDIPAGAKSGPVDIRLKADEWRSSERGVQLTITDRVHILSPIDRVSFSVDAQAICY